MSSFDFITPPTLAEACRALNAPGSRPIAGGTDIIPQWRAGRFPVDTLVDLSRLPGLSGIALRDGELVIGARTTYTALSDSPLLQAHAPLLADVSGMVGGVQTRNRGTIGGNIANASPAGDTLPPLLALDATVDLAGETSRRSLSLADFLRGPGQTALGRGEVICQVRFAPLHPGAGALFLRLGNRQGMVISIVSVACILEMAADGQVADARIALGAVAPTPIRCAEAEALLRGQPLNAGLIDQAAAAAAAAARPIDDVRASAAYRRHGVRVLVRRALTRLATPAEVEP